MPAVDWLQLALYFGILLLITKPLGIYFYNVLDVNGKTFLDKLIKPLEKLTYRILGINEKKEQNWKQFTVSMLVFSFVSALIAYIIFRFQNHLPLNPQHLPALSVPLSFNTAVSFLTNTNWQSYGGESTMSYFSQMVALTFHNFLSPAVGVAILAALVRGISRHSAQTIGNFWTDIVRFVYYVLVPLALIFGVFLISQGAIDNFKPYTTATTVQQTVEGGQTVSTQVIPGGPLASQESIKMIGTNGGGFFNANSAHPFENPNGLTDFLELLAMLAIPSGLVYYFGISVGNKKHAWALWGSMFLLCIAGFFAIYHFEQVGNPIHQQAGVAVADGNMEGKEVRFGLFSSSLWANVATDTSTGAVNTMHDSLTPGGGLVTLGNMQLDEIVFGGVGSGLFTALVYVVLAVFLAGLMIGRTPEYLGKKIEAYDVKVSALAIMSLILVILGFTAWAISSTWGLAGLNNAGPHGLSEVLYAFTSGAENNGSAFAGLTTNTSWYNMMLGVDMLIGRYLLIIPVMALAGSMARKKRVPAGPGSFPVTGTLFIVLFIAVVLLITALTFFPVLALGPIVEHYLMHAGTLF